MKRNYIGLIFMLLMALACNKGTVDLSSKENTLKGYNIEGVYDITLSSTTTSGAEPGKAKLKLNITEDSATHATLTLSVQGLPANVTAEFTPAEGAVPYASSLVFSLAGVPKSGKYPLKIVLTDNMGRTKIYPMYLTIPIVDFGVSRNASGDYHIYTSGNADNVDILSVVGSGILETVNLSFSNLPSGVEAVFSQNNMVPAYESVLSFKATGAAKGTYPITLVATSSTASESYTINLVITENCEPNVIGKCSRSLRYVDAALVDSIWEEVLIKKIDGMPGYYQFGAYTSSPRNYNVFNFSVNCNDNTVTVEKQNATINNKVVVIEGKGTYNPATRDITLDCMLDNVFPTTFHIYR